MGDFNALFKKSIETLRDVKGTLYWPKTFDLSIAKVNEEVIVNANFLASVDMKGYVTVKFNDQNNFAMPIVPGGVYKTPFTKIYLNAPAQTGCQITLLFAVIDDNPVFNYLKDVSPDDYKINTMFQKAYCGYHGYTSAALNYGHIALFNPLTPGKIIWVKNMQPANQPLIKYTAALTGGAVTTKSNKNFIGPSPVGLIQWEDNVALQGTRVGTILPYQSDPICLAPGYGIGTYGAIASALSCSFDWVEE